MRVLFDSRAAALKSNAQSAFFFYGTICVASHHCGDVAFRSVSIPQAYISMEAARSRATFRDAVSRDIDSLLEKYVVAAVRDQEEGESSAGAFERTFLPLWKSLRFSSIHEAIAMFGKRDQVLHFNQKSSVMREQIVWRTRILYALLVEEIAWGANLWRSIGAVFALYAVYKSRPLDRNVAVKLEAKAGSSLARFIRILGAKRQKSLAAQRIPGKAAKDALRSVRELLSLGAFHIGSFKSSDAQMPQDNPNYEQNEKQRVADIVESAGLRYLSLDFSSFAVCANVAQRLNGERAELAGARQWLEDAVATSELCVGEIVQAKTNDVPPFFRRIQCSGERSLASRGGESSSSRPTQPHQPWTSERNEREKYYLKRLRAVTQLQPSTIDAFHSNTKQEKNDVDAILSARQKRSNVSARPKRNRRGDAAAKQGKKKKKGKATKRKDKKDFAAASSRIIPEENHDAVLADDLISSTLSLAQRFL